MFSIACFRLSVISSLFIFASFSFTSSLASRVDNMTSVLALSLRAFSIRAFTSGSGCAGRFLAVEIVGLFAALWAASAYVLGGSETVFPISSNLASILSNRFSYSFSMTILCVIFVAFFMETLTVSMIGLACLLLTLFKSSAIVSRSFSSSSKRVLFPSVICSVCCGGVSGIGVSPSSYGSVMLLGGVGSITGVALGGGGIGVPALAVPCFSLFVLSDWVVLLLVSRALTGHGVFSVLFLASVCGLDPPAVRLGAGGAGLSRWGGGVRCIVSCLSVVCN